MCDGLQDLDFMSAVVLVLVHVPPEGYVCLLVSGQGLGQDPPAMPIQDHIFQGLLVHQRRQVAYRRLGPILDAPKGQVEVGACEGCVPGP